MSMRMGETKRKRERKKEIEREIDRTERTKNKMLLRLWWATEGFDEGALKWYLTFSLLVRYNLLMQKMYIVPLNISNFKFYDFMNSIFCKIFYNHLMMLLFSMMIGLFEMI